MIKTHGINLTGRGLRGESQADILRRTGRYGVLPTDNDDEAMGKLNAAAEAWAEGTEPGGPGTKSAKGWAEKVMPLYDAMQGVGSEAFSISGFILSSGEPTTSDFWFRTDFIPVEGGVEYTVTSRTEVNAWHAWYDANQVFISSFRQPTNALTPVNFTSPANARYVRLSTRDVAVSGSSFAPSTGRLSIDQVRDIASEFAVVPAERVPYADTTVGAELTSVLAQILALRDGQVDIINELDLQSDRVNPLFVNSWLYTKSHVTVASAEEITIVSRNSDTQFTVAAGKGSLLPVGGAIVVYDASADLHTSVGVKSIAGDVVTVYGVLPPTCTSCETMHENNNGQHLSRLGYKGFAEFIVDQAQRYSYRKLSSLVFAYNPYEATTPTAADPDVYDRETGLTKLIDVTALGGAGYGGFVSGTTDLPRFCSTSTSDANPDLSAYLRRRYFIQDNGSGKGMEFTINAQGADGFVEIPLSAARISYNSGANFTEGRARLEVLADGVSIHDQIYVVGPVHMVRVDISRASLLTVRFTLADNVPSSIRLGGVWLWRKSPQTPMAGFFKSGDKVALLCDSWGVYPLPKAGEVPPLRPDGSPGEGMAFLAGRLREVLSEDGIDITTLNYSKGGMTSAWGRYWVNEIIDAKPTHCIINFAINDRNSITNPSSTGYNFSPTDMWSTLVEGVDGSISDAAEWQANMEEICSRLLSAGIKVIWLMPPHTGSIAQTTLLNSSLLTRLVDGVSLS